ncbi:MAG: hypothetical protein RLZZ127_329 [Planctomycetota bacterium]
MRPCPALLLIAAAGLGAADDSTAATAAAPAPATPVTDLAVPAAQDPGRARRAPAAPAAAGWWGLTARAGLGWDSNPVLESDIDPDASGDGSAVWSGELVATLRLVRAERAGLTANLGGEYVDYPSERQVSLLRVGGSLRGNVAVDAGALGRIDPGAIIGAYGFWADDEHQATALQGSLFATRIDPAWILVASAGATRLDYPDDEDLTGTQVDGAIRTMVLTTPGRTGDRIELGLRGGAYVATADQESYASLQPSLVAAVRGGGDRPGPGVVDLTGRLGLERRWYDDQTQSILTMSGALDRWYTQAFALGMVLAITDRESSDQASGYDRVQFMTRASYTW